MERLGSEPENHQTVTDGPRGDGGEEIVECLLAGCNAVLNDYKETRKY